LDPPDVPKWRKQIFSMVLGLADVIPDHEKTIFFTFYFVELYSSGFQKVITALVSWFPPYIGQ
jgi:hypothetical protein